MKVRIVTFRILFILYIIAVIWLCVHNFKSIEQMPHRLWGFQTDKLIHFAMFLPFPFFAYLSYDKRRFTFLRTTLFILATLVLGAVLAGATELAQSFIPRRTADVKDLVADFIALGTGILIVFIVDLSENIRHNRKKKR